MLIGHSDRGNKRLHNIEEVAEFICKHGVDSNVTVTTEDGKRLLDTFGIYLNKISDMEYREELLKVLIPMQIKTENEAFEEESEQEEVNMDNANAVNNMEYEGREISDQIF